MFLKRVATLLAAKTGQETSLDMANLRRRLRFELLKTVLVDVRGHRGRYYQKAIPVDELDLNSVHTTNDEENGDDVDDVRRCSIDKIFCNSFESISRSFTINEPISHHLPGPGLSY